MWWCIYYKHNSSQIQLFALSDCSVCLVAGTMQQRKQLNLTWIMFIIDTSSQSDSFKKKWQNHFTLIPNWPGLLTPIPATKYTEHCDKEKKNLLWYPTGLDCLPPSLQLSIQNIATKKSAKFDLNYVYNWYIFTIR